MALPKPYNSLSGEWKGTKRVYLNGENGPVHESRSRLTIAAAARDCYLMLAYTWKFEAAPHEGVMLLGYDEQQNAATAAWGDSWHMSRKIMHCSGEINGNGIFDVRGSYEAPPGPDWGWGITLGVKKPDAMEIEMFNYSPEGEQSIAVRAAFARAG
jgi:hypothetical protein